VGVELQSLITLLHARVRTDLPRHMVGPAEGGARTSTRGPPQSHRGHFVDAAVALNLFLLAQQKQRIPTQDEWERDAARRCELMEQFERELRADGSFNALKLQVYEEISERADIALKHERWNAGTPPPEYAWRLPFLHARSFIYALDSIGKIAQGVV
jgi:hypothetical protein